MALMRWLPLLLAAGCTDTFALPIGGPGGGDDFGPFGGGDGFSDEMSVNPGDDGGADLAGADLQLALPASCAMLSCTPAMNEGDVTLGDHISGCHAYGTLTISGTSTTMSGQAFQACADMIFVGGALSADGKGASAGMGAGAGKSCSVVGASGGSYGGAGGDPAACGVGATYGNMMAPTDFGSGAGQGGNGGGALELAAGMINLIGFISADGESSGTGGGGSGGSILIHAGSIVGVGSILARGGQATVNPQAGGGGGGRIAVILSTAAPQLTVDASGGSSQGTGGNGASGTIYRMP
jgi:hypothetical protein